MLILHTLGRRHVKLLGSAHTKVSINYFTCKVTLLIYLHKISYVRIEYVIIYLYNTCEVFMIYLARNPMKWIIFFFLFFVRTI